MTENYRDKPTDWDCRVFIAVVENRSYRAAASQLTDVWGSYSRQSVGRAVEKIEAWAGETLLQRKAGGTYSLTAAGDTFLSVARRLVALYDGIDSGPVEPPLWTLACAPHHTQFVTLAADRLRAENGDADKIRVEYLERTARGEEQFQGEPVDRLVRQEFRLIIGPEVVKSSLLSIPLYRAQLEAMVERRFRGDRLSLSDLVSDYEALLQPQDIRARRALELAIQQSDVVDPGGARIAMETTETAAIVMRLRTEARREGGRNRVMVVPSDVAQPYKKGMEFGGRGASRFKWVPIHASSGPLSMPTYVTIRKDDATVLRRVIEELQAGVATLDAGPHPISGTPLASSRALPSQRR
ncbi:DNA-binding transcriptional regulator, LysR family [Asanoa hainanensis]|uniref:DNA-binding transcriptional regulator, LysR family n=1 Tax=Asanoa hainanensis TaxID=560556 RepID=A0A239PDU7_9ACTN|nr:LysR family transcriptional regulator [Asanoa hainanensis]SNT65197.1 DNA-binding transcriptional regulator, LysR family [Asanoa hainanensis]